MFRNNHDILSETNDKNKIMCNYLVNDAWTNYDSIICNKDSDSFVEQSIDEISVTNEYLMADTFINMQKMHDYNPYMDFKANLFFNDGTQDQRVSHILNNMRSSELVNKDDLNQVNLEIENKLALDVLKNMKKRQEEARLLREKRQNTVNDYCKKQVILDGQRLTSSQAQLEKERILKFERKIENDRFQMKLVKIRNELEKSKSKLLKRKDENIPAANINAQPKSRSCKNDDEIIPTSQKTMQKGLVCIFRDKWDRILNKQILKRQFQAWSFFVRLRANQLDLVAKRNDQILKDRYLRVWLQAVALCRTERQDEFLDFERKLEMAERHFKKSLLRRICMSWSVLTRVDKINKAMIDNDEKLKQKSAAFLNYVASPRLNIASEDMPQSASSTSLKMSAQKIIQPLSSRVQAIHDRNAQDESLLLYKLAAMESAMYSNQLADDALKRVSLKTEKRVAEIEKLRRKVELDLDKKKPLVRKGPIYDWERKSSARSETSSKSSETFRKKSAFLQKMEQEKEKRQKLLQQAQDRRERIKAEQLAVMREKAAKIHEEIEDDKKRRAEEAKENKRLQEEKRKRIEAFNRRQVELNEFARQKRSLLLIKFHGLLPWKAYIVKLQQNEIIAENHDRLRIIGSIFQNWRKVTLLMIEQKTLNADQCYRGLLCKRMLSDLAQAVSQRRVLEMKAIQYFRTSFLRKVFFAWKFIHMELVKARLEKEDAADRFQRQILLQTFFDAMECHVGIAKADRARQKRLEKYRQRIADIVPDFSPTLSSSENESYCR